MPLLGLVRISLGSTKNDKGIVNISLMQTSQSAHSTFLIYPTALVGCIGDRVERKYIYGLALSFLSHSCTVVLISASTNNDINSKLTGN